MLVADRSVAAVAVAATAAAAAAAATSYAASTVDGVLLLPHAAVTRTYVRVSTSIWHQARVTLRRWAARDSCMTS